MNTVVQNAFDAVEAALATLLDSITSYAPSTAAADALLAADTQLTAALSTLAVHQAAHTRLLRLRAIAAAQDARIKAELASLAALRAELLGLPLSAPASASPDRKEIDYKTLMSVAQRISRFSVPPTRRAPLPPPLPIKEEGAGEDGAVTSAPQSAAAETETEAKAPLGADNEALQAWLAPPSHALPFYPWPGEDRIRGGGLGACQGWVERGVDPWSIGIGGGEEAETTESEGKNAEGPVKRESIVRPMGHGARVPTVGGPERTDVFEDMELYDPDEEG